MTNKNLKTKQRTLDVGMKVGLLQTIATAIYGNTQGKIREAVANSKDNDASMFMIFVDRGTKTLSLFDNGKGITEERFVDIFKNLGYGLDKENANSLSYFGLGLMSILRLGKKANIYTRTYREGNVLRLTVNSESIFNRDNEKESIDFIKRCINLTDSDLTSRNTLSPLREEHIKEYLGEFPYSFTEIVIEDVYDYDFDFITGNDCEEVLRKLLPLRLESSEPFLKRIKDTKAREWLSNMLSNQDYCPSLDVFFGVSGERELKQLWKYFPDFKRDLDFGEANIIYGESAENAYAYFFLFGTEDLEDRQKKGTETGFWVRNRNFLVKPADYLIPAGSKKKPIQEPLKNWIFGEIFHKNMNSFLNVSRDDYVWDSPDFDKFSKGVFKLVVDLNQELRKAWAAGKAIEDAVITPFTNLVEPYGPLARVNKTLEKAGIPCDGEDAAKVFELLKKRRQPVLEDDKNRIEYLLKKGGDKITLIDNEEALVVIDKTVQGEIYTKTLDAERKRITISISPSLFATREVLFLGKTFKVILVSGGEDGPGVSVNTEEESIYINPFNNDMLSYSMSFLDVYIAVEIADAKTKTKNEMKAYLLKLLGANYSNAEKYLVPLADDLRRKRQSR